MDAKGRIERALAQTLARLEPGSPPRLIAAMQHAVFPGGARLRPRLVLAVAGAIGECDPAIADAAAIAIECLHCASLVHDDLPCFDDAAIRRGRPSVHRAFGAPIAVLAGDALIVLAFQSLALGAAHAPQCLAALSLGMARAAGTPFGIAAGQAWESEETVDLARYQRAKTGALFAAATVAGAAAAGAEPEAWRPLGEHLGEAYQVADDLADALGEAERLGKPVGQDAAHGRPNAVHRLGVAGAIAHLRGLADEAAASIPDCPGIGPLQALIRQEATRLLPVGVLTPQAA